MDGCTCDAGEDGGVVHRLTLGSGVHDSRYLRSSHSPFDCDVDRLELMSVELNPGRREVLMVHIR